MASILNMALGFFDIYTRVGNLLVEQGHDQLRIIGLKVSQEHLQNSSVWEVDLRDVSGQCRDARGYYEEPSAAFPHGKLFVEDADLAYDLPMPQEIAYKRFARECLEIKTKAKMLEKDIISLLYNNGVEHTSGVESLGAVHEAAQHFDAASELLRQATDKILPSTRFAS